jgi:hypothetical protein
VIQGGWVCRACWHPNGPREDRCYRCHTPRDEQLAVEAGSLKAQTEPGYQLRGRLDASLPILAYLTAWPLRVTGALDIGIGALIVIVGLLRGDAGLPSLLGMPANIWLSLFGMLYVLVGFLKIFIATSVRRYARWAYVVTIVATVGSLASTVVGPSIPADSGDLATVLWWINTWVTFGIAMGATALLLASFVRRPIDEVESPL